MNDLMDQALALNAGDHPVWQVNHGLLSPLFLPNPEKLLALPPGDRLWRVFDLALGAQQSQNLTVTFGQRAWILALMGSFDQNAGFRAILFDAARKRAFGTTRELSINLVGTARNPAWLPTPAELDPNTPLFVRVTNLAAVAGTGQLVLYSHLESEDVTHGR